jgi:hypothetical protein
VTLADAVRLIGGPGLAAEPETWADLGAGDGTFTLALATVLPDGSVIHAMDRDAGALRAIPARHRGTSIRTHTGDFTVWPWPFDPPSGVLLANALHYVRDQRGFVGACAAAMPAGHRLLVVEYDTDVPNPWVPYPLSRTALERLFGDAGYRTVIDLGARPSRYQRAGLYAALIAGPPVP